MTKNKRKKIPSIRKYDMGYFVDPKNRNDIASGGMTAASLLGLANNNPRHINTGLDTAQGALSGAATGFQMAGPWGAAAGAAIGGVSSLIGSKNKQRQQDAQNTQINQDQIASLNSHQTNTNINPYGSLMYADGDTIQPSPMSAKNYLVNYVNSSTYKKRLNSSGAGSKPQSLEDIYNTNIIHDVNNESLALDKSRINKYSDKALQFGVNNIVINPNQIKETGGNEDEFQAHELSHIARKLTPNEQNIIGQKNISPEGIALWKQYEDSGKKTDYTTFIDTLTSKNIFHHDEKPNENKADLDALRYQMYKNGIYDTSKGDLDLPTLQKALENPTIKSSFTTRRLLKTFKPEDLVYLNNTIASIPSDNITQNYADGGSINIKPSHKGRFTAYKERTGETTEEALHSKDPHVRQMANFAKNAALWHHEDGDFVLGNNPNNQDPNSPAVNTQQNVINIQKGELLIHPETGKILQEFTGINPLTGGMYEPHSKGKNKESEHNFTLADPGLFVITKKTAKQYKDAVDNNDEVSKKTVLMNIRNAKIQKEGGLKSSQMISPNQSNYAFGDSIQDPNYPIPYLNVKSFNPNSSVESQPLGPFRPSLSTSNLRSAGFSGITPRGVVDSTIPNTYQPDAPQPSKFSDVASGITNTLTKYGPSLLNIGQGLFGQVENQPYAKRAVNPYTNQVIGNMPKDIDMSPIINDIRSTQNLANKDLLNNTNNSSVYRANRQQIDSNANKALTSARLGAQEQNNKTAGTRGAIYNNLGLQDVQDQQQRREYDLSVDDINARRQGAKQNLLNAGLSQLQQTNMNDKTNQQKQGMDKYTLNLMSQIFPNLKYYDDFNIDKINSLLGRK